MLGWVEWVECSEILYYLPTLSCLQLRHSFWVRDSEHADHPPPIDSGRNSTELDNPLKLDKLIQIVPDDIRAKNGKSE